jgi:hypothetical protein
MTGRFDSGDSSPTNPPVSMNENDVSRCCGHAPLGQFTGFHRTNWISGFLKTLGLPLSKFGTGFGIVFVFVGSAGSTIVRGISKARLLRSLRLSSHERMQRALDGFGAVGSGIS